MRVIRDYKEARAYLGRRRLQELEMASPGTGEHATPLFGEPLPPAEVVRRILHDVRERGDAALAYYTERLEGSAPSTWEVPGADLDRAKRSVPAEVLRALEQSAERVRAFHETSLPRTWVDFSRGYGELYTPVERAGAYIPGGSASYPSTVLMTAIPARVAGVSEVIVTTPRRDDEGPDPAVLAACRVAGVDRVFQAGGAQAIGALAYGTGSVPRVDLICGPGNLYVTLAKKQVYGEVAVDGLYGPTETVIVADGRADPEECAADLIAQGEHDPLSSPVLITTDGDLLPRVEAVLERQLEGLARAGIARAALDNQGCAVVAGDLEQAFELANLFAPEHMCLLIEDPWTHLDKVRNAGGVFLGTMTPEVLGDYVAGPSHVMPTGGTARFGSPLGVHQFLKVTAVVGLNRRALQRLAPATSIMAHHEGLTGHARAVEMRLEERDNA